MDSSDIRKNIQITFNYVEFDFIEIDLKHINHGKSHRRKTLFTYKDVMEITKALINNTFLYSSDFRKYADENCTYFMKEGTYQKKKYKLVFCVCSDRPTTIGIITMFRVGPYESL